MGTYKSIMRFASITIIWAALFSVATQGSEQIKVLAIADAQYAQKPARINRYYSDSIKKLERIEELHRGENFSFLVNLGDSVDEKRENLAPVLEALNKFSCPKYHVMGNHDLADSAENVDKIQKSLGIGTPPYSYFDRDSWRFVFLDTNALCQMDPRKRFPEQAEALKKKMELSGKKYKLYNGGIDSKQLEWLDGVLSDADSKNLNVAMFAHSPIDSKSDTLLNADEVISILNKHSSAKIWINGHRHKGGYYKPFNTHLLTINGLVEDSLDTLSYAILTFSKNTVRVKGKGRMKSYELKLDVKK